MLLLAIAVLGRWGLAMAGRLGRGLPWIAHRLAGAPPPRRFAWILALGALVGTACAAAILAMDFGVFRAPMLAMFQARGITPPESPLPIPWHGFLAAVSAGVTEETLFRLFGLSLLVWIGTRITGAGDDGPGPAVFWTANALIALAFAAVHLTTAHAIGWPMNALVLARTLVLNGVAALAFGWLFWNHGLESAILAHCFTDVALYTLLPIVLGQGSTTATVLAAVNVGVLLVLGMMWAARTLTRDRSRERPAAGRIP